MVTEGVWNKVGGRISRKHRSVKWDIVRKESGVLRISVSTYFITDFEEKWNARDLYMEFKDLGLLEEIVIPPTRDWRGQRFGFVRFINVEDEKFLETKLDNIWLDGSKLKANIYRIKRKAMKPPNKAVDKTNNGGSNLKGGIQQTEIRNGKDYLGKNHIIINEYMTKGGSSTSRSFADVIKGETVLDLAMSREACKSFYYSSSETEKMRYEKAKVRVTRKPGSAYCVAQSLIEEVIFTISAIALGPNLYLLEENKEGDLKALLEDGGDWKSFWFKEIRDWKKTNAECARVT